MSLIQRDTNDPILLALRSDLKRHFLIYLEMNDNELAKKWPGAELVVYGSTLMRKLSENQDIHLPYWGRKASDIDIGICTEAYVEADSYINKYKEIIPPLMLNTILRGQFNVEIPKGASEFETILRNNMGEYFSTDAHLEKLSNEFVISKSYNKEQVVHILKKAKLQDLAQQVDASQQKEYYADTIISIQPCPPQMLLGSSDFLPNRVPPEHRIDLRRDKRMNLLASKIVRAFDPKKPVKPTDFIDFYNLAHASPQLFDFTANSPDFEDLRCLIVAHMAAAGLHKLDTPPSNLMRHFVISSQNIDLFMDNYSQVISTRQPISREETERFIKEARDLVFHAFGYWEDNANTMLEELLSLNERNFLASQHGYTVMPGGYTKSRQGEFNIDSALLKADHPKTFERYPRLEHNIQNYHLIAERVQKNIQNFDLPTL